MRLEKEQRRESKDGKFLQLEDEVVFWGTKFVILEDSLERLTREDMMFPDLMEYFDTGGQAGEL